MASSKPSDKKKASSAAKKPRRAPPDAASRSKDRDKPKKPKERRAAKKDKLKDPPAASPPSAEPAGHDPDAIQLFRRYDRSRSGALTRLDFLQLLRDYANPNGAAGPTSRPARAPLSLTDSSGIPLGYARADRNSEFEAGQLFERYDRRHAGALTLADFHVFFADFKPQLRVFADDCNYGSPAPPPAAVVPAPLHPVKEGEQHDVPSGPTKRVSDATTDPREETPVDSAKSLRAQYRSALWKLRRVCKDELFAQRQLLLRHMDAMREDMAWAQRRASDAQAKRPTPFLGFEATSSGDDARDEPAGRYETLEDDLDRLDELVRVVRRHLRQGDGVSKREMLAFIAQADDLQEEAQALAMKDYGQLEPHTSPKPETKEVEHAVARSPAPAPVSGAASPARDGHRQQSDVESLLRVKDQMIFQLLQERTAMRRERAALETSLKQLSDVSTHEMKKWARLTDDMQAEIEQLRGRLKRPQSPSQRQRQRQRHAFV